MVQQLNKINEAAKSLLAEVADFPLVGPYMVAFLLAAHVAVGGLLFWGVVILSYMMRLEAGNALAACGDYVV